MSVHYKFKSALDFDTITFDGLHISVSDLKRAIMQQKRLGKTAEFDLQITNAQTKEGKFTGGNYPHYSFINSNSHFRIRGRLCADPEEHFVDHSTHPFGQSDEEAMESTGGGKCERPEEARSGTGACGSLPDEWDRGGQDCSNDNAEHHGLRSHQVSYKRIWENK